ncbi:Phosphate transport system permease protein PstC [Candidatus Sulfotelmatomonas gaucii]|uniref:Phosphate transport system permease protein n=1 Tax=Candidatus Sulfuritelmatomonas gaucii TaxID=2043161 RepID=A0A2N9LFL9_9BACT|nr:Phosphate transport system permease protein PstC [Candidatus Sulfotelmatomonas gaucii]
MDATVPEIRIVQTQPPSEPAQTPEQAAAVAAPVEHSAIRRYLLARGNSAITDGAFRVLMALCAFSIFVIVALILFELVQRSQLTLHAFGLKFFYKTYFDPTTNLPSYWDPVNGYFSALPFVYGTLVSSLLSLLFAVPLAIGVAVFLTEMCPNFLCAPLAFLTELLAAIPSIIYGLWAVFILVPLLREYVNPLLIKGLGWTGLFDDTSPTGMGYFASAVILAIMILPIISSLTREVMSAVPHSQREAVLALGATRWEMIRMGVLRNARVGIVGAVILGLGRALGETMAVTMVIGSTPQIHHSLLSTGSSMASVIASEFTEAVSDMHLSALIEIGLALFIVTIIVNAIARLLVWAVTRGAPATTH